MKRHALILAISVMAATQLQAADAPKSLCQADEDIVFACSTGKKLISVCASQNLSAADGYVQYRFGNEGNIEMSVPESKAHPSKFSTGGSLMYSGGGGAYMRFNNGGYGYVVYSGMGKGWDKQGVAVEKDGKLLTNILCKNTSIETIGPDFFEKNAIPEDKVGFEIP